MVLRLASSVVTPLVKRLFRTGEPGAGLVAGPVRLSALVTFRGEKQTLTEAELTRLARALVDRAARDLDPHDPLPEGERACVAEALAQALLGLGELGMDDVQAVRLGHRELARRLREARPGLPEGHLLARDAEHLFEALLDVACLHILNFFTQRSAFVARTLVEQSRLLDRLVRTADLIAERLPPRSVEDAAFEKRYAAYVGREHGRLTVHGLDLEQSRRWPLDDAYLSLETHDQPEAPPRRAEVALAYRPRVLLRGLAGSGKTTLVQWLAVAAAGQDVDSGIPDLFGHVPFVLPVRTLTRDGRSLPLPGAFLSAVDCPLAGAQPERWADRVLAAGRGLLLVDGVDEIPEEEREGVRRWLRRLESSYPGNRWLVTARPSAIERDWLGAEGFAELTLAPMGRDDVGAFVHRWHRAVGAQEQQERALRELLDRRADLAALATSPLMCALICALHRERNGHLPRGRKALYDAALTMLLERRDRERPDPPRGGLDLDTDTQLSLLQKLAYWLITNGRAELNAELAARLLAQALPALGGGQALGSGAEVLRHLVERSGVLREPMEGAVDFVHRTFQDYLGAREIVEWQHFPALVEKAHLDQWEDVVRMAVAHAQPLQRGELLTALLERGDRDQEHRTRLHLLAVACLDQATQLAPEVREAVAGRAARFLPPRVPAEGVSLAAAGAVALSVLPPPDGLGDQEAAAVVLAAVRVGTDAAIPHLRPFRNHPSPEVRHRLATSWYRFGTERYFEEVIAHLRLDGEVTLPVTSREELRLLERMRPRPRRVDLRGGFTTWDIATRLASLPLTALGLRECRELGGVGFVRDFPELTGLLIDACPQIRDLSPLAGTGVRTLSLHADAASWRPQGLARLQALAELTLGRLFPLGALAELPAGAPLRALTLPARPPVLTGLAAWPSLTHLGLQHCARALSAAEAVALAGLPRLVSVSLSLPVLRSLARAGVVLPAVEAVTCLSHEGPRPEDGDLAALAAVFPGLARLHLVGWQSLGAAPLAGLPGLRAVRCSEPLPRPAGLPAHVEFLAPPAPRY
ncbi:NACHT domain-containing protein [Streptomyces hoynatensis]|uniref:NACHT domain-containing protein n=2 Tax=Streptomyces hoynatensis TaxID=1141874 RepID=A0A3A9Z6J6_9ACTN|nr:NACHT domain-containing protein [Streptomyces hoynatensis]